MRKWLFASLFVVLPAAAFGAEGIMDWAYPMPPAGLPPVDNVSKKQAKGTKTTLSLTQQEINNPFGPPDWFPDEHPPMPSVVSNGRRPNVMACMLCHLPNGGGHPESASVSGLTAKYTIDQMHAFRDGDRKNVRTPAMERIAKDITEEELKQAAEYFASLQGPALNWYRTVESATVPKNHVGPGGMRFRDEAGGTAPLPANMIVELPEDEEGAENRDQHAGFIAYVPMGSIKKGETLALTGAGKTIQCAICHGEGLKGLGDVPRLAGRSPYYVIRQLKDIQSGARKGTSVALMQPVVKGLSDDDIINLAAYIVSREP
jgi:cytochrome c553